MGRHDIRNKHDQTCMQLGLNKVDAAVSDEREFIFDDRLSQFPNRLGAQAKVFDMGYFETSSMSDTRQACRHSSIRNSWLPAGLKRP